jgi:hypothetical protein
MALTGMRKGLRGESAGVPHKLQKFPVYEEYEDESATSPVLWLDDYKGEKVWGEDLFHPLAIGYHHLVDLCKSKLAA